MIWLTFQFFELSVCQIFHHFVWVIIKFEPKVVSLYNEKIFFYISFILFYDILLSVYFTIRWHKSDHMWIYASITNAVRQNVHLWSGVIRLNDLIKMHSIQRLVNIPYLFIQISNPIFLDVLKDCFIRICKKAIYRILIAFVHFHTIIDTNDHLKRIK